MQHILVDRKFRFTFSALPLAALAALLGANACSAVDAKTASDDLEESSLSARKPGADAATDCFQSGCGIQQVCKGRTRNGTCIDVPPPPENCMAPCLWEARRNCLPVMGACNYDSLLIPPRNWTRYCDAKTDWTKLFWYGSAGYETELQRAGQQCYRWFKASGASWVWYEDATGPIAVAFGEESAPERTVYCGPYGIENTPPPPDAPSFTEINSAECQRWKDTYLSLTECRTHESGTCTATP